MNRLLCFLLGHTFRMYRDLQRISPTRVECPCQRCGRVVAAEYGLALPGHHDFTRRTRLPNNASLREAITEMLREIERCPDDSMQDIANEALKTWRTGLRVDSGYVIEAERE